jgi:AcrR family transcriptional regulator/DNA-binding MarR family transcriptional regulator
MLVSSRTDEAGARRKARPGEKAAARAAPSPVALERLRPGRDSLSRDKVDGIQRSRIVSAMGEVVAERGAGAATVANVVARAGVSRRTFYELFEDREDCFLAAFDHAVGLACEAVLPAYAGEARWQDRIRAGLAALLAFLEQEPDLGALVVVHGLGAGQAALERRARIVQGLIAAVDEGRAAGAGRRGAPQPAPLTAEGIVGAVLAVIHARLAQRERREPLLALLGPLMSAIVLPYLGAGAAAKELERPAPAGRARPRRAAGDPLKELDMRLTYRTVRVLIAIGSHAGASNRQVGEAAGIADQGQISKLLARLDGLGLIENRGAGHSRGEANAWQLTDKGEEVERTIRAEAAPAPAG